MFAKNVFDSHLESIICKTKIRACACARRASPAGRLHPSTPHPPIYIGGGGVGCEGLCGGHSDFASSKALLSISLRRGSMAPTPPPISRSRICTMVRFNS